MPPRIALNIGLLGGGTVGGGVYDLVMSRMFPSSSSSNAPMMTISKLCVSNLSKSRDFHIDPSRTTVTDDLNSVLDDPNINVVVEVMGGVTLARDAVLKALSSGKHVVTANKALIASCMRELNDALAVGARLKAASGGAPPPVFAFEAAVCGGIPIIASLHNTYNLDTITSVMGICNGTTNYMLCKMEAGADYAAVLKEAQALGYAEADPTADVEGHDVRSKISILATLSFNGIVVPPEKIPTVGISKLSALDFEYAKLLGCTIKLLGVAARTPKFSEHDGPLAVYVSPHLVPLTHALAGPRAAGNAVVVSSINCGVHVYAGPGAGRFPTANSVVADLDRIARGAAADKPFGANFGAAPTKDDVPIDGDFSAAFYIRISIKDGLGIIRRVGEVAEKHGISIEAVLQNPITDRERVDFVVTTERCLRSQVEGMCADVEKLEFARKRPIFMPILS